MDQTALPILTKIHIRSRRPWPVSNSMYQCVHLFCTIVYCTCLLGPCPRYMLHRELTLRVHSARAVVMTLGHGVPPHGRRLARYNLTEWRLRADIVSHIAKWWPKYMSGFSALICLSMQAKSCKYTDPKWKLYTVFKSIYFDNKLSFGVNFFGHRIFNALSMSLKKLLD